MKAPKVRVRVRVPKGLMLNPVARDPRVAIKWYHGKGGVEYVGVLTGNEKVVLRWYKGLSGNSYVRREPRAPTAVDVNILFWWLYWAQVGRSNVVKFRTEGEFIHSMYLTAKGYQMHQRLIGDAARLWQHLSLTIDGVVMEPPLKELRRDIVHPSMKRVVVTLSEQWLEMCKKNVIQISLPLPMHASPQNVVLHTLGVGSQKRVAINSLMYELTGNAKARPIMQRAWYPQETWLVASRWYKLHGGRLDYAREPFRLYANHYEISKHMATMVQRP